MNINIKTEKTGIATNPTKDSMYSGIIVEIKPCMEPASSILIHAIAKGDHHLMLMPYIIR
jgi:hypothetical protein